MRSLALIALLGMTGCEAAPQYEHVHASTLTLKIGNSGCSGTAVGRYTLLSASHCFEADTRTILANGKECKVWKIVNDGNDHALLTVSCEFKAWANVGWGAKAGRVPKLGTKVFMFGSPLDFTDLLRFGRVAGEQAKAMPGMGTATIYDITGGPGDSGAGIFNMRGQVIGVLSIGNRHIPADGDISPRVFQSTTQGGRTLMAIKRFFMGDDTKARTKKIDAAEKEAVKGKPVKKPVAKKPPR